MRPANNIEFERWIATCGHAGEIKYLEAESSQQGISEVMTAVWEAVWADDLPEVRRALDLAQESLP